VGEASCPQGRLTNQVQSSLGSSGTRPRAPGAEQAGDGAESGGRKGAVYVAERAQKNLIAGTQIQNTLLVGLTSALSA